MSLENVRWEARPDAPGGDPGKLKYLHDPNWQGTPRVEGFKVDQRSCPGCLFPDAKPGKWPHTKDARCKLLREAGMPRCSGKCGDAECEEAAAHALEVSCQ